MGQRLSLQTSVRGVVGEGTPISVDTFSKDSFAIPGILRADERQSLTDGSLRLCVGASNSDKTEGLVKSDADKFRQIDTISIFVILARKELFAIDNVLNALPGQYIYTEY